MPSTTQKRIHCVTLNTLEEVPGQQAIRLQVPNYRLGRVTPFELSVNRIGYATFAPGEPNVGKIYTAQRKPGNEKMSLEKN